MLDLFKKKPDASMLLGIGGAAVSLIGMLIKGKQTKLAESETVNKAAEKAYEKVMEQLSSKKG